MPNASTVDGNFGRVEAIDLKTKQVVWSHRQRAPIASSLLASSGGLLFSGGGAFDAGSRSLTPEIIDPAAGTTVWVFKLNDLGAAAMP